MFIFMKILSRIPCWQYSFLFGEISEGSVFPAGGSQFGCPGAVATVSTALQVVATTAADRESSRITTNNQFLCCFSEFVESQHCSVTPTATTDYGMI